MNPIQITKEEEGNYYLPCGSPFQNRPMTPIDLVIQDLYNTMANLSNDRIYEIQQYTFLRLNNNSNQSAIYDEDHIDDHHKDDFQSISVKEVSKVQVKENINVDVKEEDSKVKVIEEVKVLINKDVEKDDADDTDDDEEVSNANSRSVSESDSDHDNSEPKPKYEPKSDSNKTNSKQGAVKVDFSINTTFIFGKIVSIDEERKAKVLLDDKRIGSFPANFKYFGKIDDKVRLTIKHENNEKKMLILNLINIHFEKDDEVTGIISINDSNEIYVNVPGIKMASFPKKFTEYTNLKFHDGMKVSCSIFKTYDYKEKNTNKIVGIGANLTFNSIIY
jgi:hypothetical protein